MDTVVHLPRWRGEDGLLSYGTVVPKGVATPTGSFTKGYDVTCCDPLSESTTTSSTSSIESFSTAAATTGNSTTTSAGTETPSSSSPRPSSTSSSESSSHSSKLSNDSIIGLSVGLPASIAGIAGVCVAIYFGRRHRAAP